MALAVSTDAIIEKLSGTAGADSQVHSITSGQIIVCVGCKVVDGGTKQFTVKVMHPDATAEHAATLARPIIKGLLGQAVTAEETAAAQEAEREHLHDTKSFSANQLGRIFSGWAGWLETLRANKMLEADEARRDEGVPAQFRISGANEALKVFRKLPQCKEAEEGHVVTAEVLKVARCRRSVQHQSPPVLESTPEPRQNHARATAIDHSPSAHAARQARRPG